MNPGCRLLLLFFVGIFTIVNPVYGASTAEELLFSGRVSEAWPIARAAAQAAPDDLDAQELYIDLAIHLGIQLVAEATLRKRVEANPADANSQYLLGRAARSVDEAERSYREALRLDPGHARAHMGLGAIHRIHGKLAEADAAYRKALMLDPNLSEAWAGLQQVLLTGGFRAQALEAARLAVANVGDRAEPYLALATLEPERGIEILENGAGKAGRDPQIHVVLASLYVLANEGKKGTVSARRALSIHPGHRGAALWLLYADEMVARRLDGSGVKDLIRLRQQLSVDPATAATQIQALAQRYPKSALVLMLASQAWALVKEEEKALQAMEKALKLNPGNEEAVAGLGMAYARAGQWKNARVQLERAVAARPGDASLVIGLCTANWNLGERQAAIARMATLQKARPHDVRVILQLAGWLQEADLAKESYELLQLSARQTPDVRIAVALAAIARDLGNIDEAVGILKNLAKETGSPKVAEAVRQLEALQNQ